MPAGATGKVTFYDGTTVLGISTISGAQATLITTLLASGTRSLRAYYAGSATYAASTSASISQTVIAGASLGFKPAIAYATTSASDFTAVGDFNGDGKQDLAVATQTGLNILLGNGDGTFQAAVNYNAGNPFGCVVAGDFNGDGKIDLAAVSSLSGNIVSVLLGNGDGTFQTAVNYPAGYYLESLVAADFNGDGIIDLATANNYGNGVNVLLGNGDGTFRAAVNYLTNADAESVAAADLNGDGKADLVIATSSGISVLLGKGDGTFQAAISSNVDTAFTAIAVADFNGDGKADVALTSYYPSSLSVLLGNGDGTFQPAVAYAVSYESWPVIAGDFNGDGKVDLAVANDYCCNSGNLNVLFGNGDGTFQAAVNYSFSQETAALASGDFNGDGKMDLVASGPTTSPTSGTPGVYILLGGAIPDLSVVLQGGPYTQGQIGAAFDITVTNVGSIATSGAVGVVASLPASVTATAIAGNGWTCVLGTLVCARSDSLAAGASYPVIKITVNVAGSFTGSVTSSATVSGGGGQSSANNTAADTTFVRFSTSTSLSASPNPAVLGHAVTLTATAPSLVTGKVTFYDGVTVLGAAPVSGGQAAFVTHLLASGARSLRAEYDGDSTYGPSVSPVYLEQISVVATNGALPSTSYKVGPGPESIGVGDFNRDGKLDLVTAIQGGISVQLGNGDGTFRPAVTYAANGTFPIGLVVGDFNNDGNPDVAVSYNNGLYVLLGNGDGSFQASVSYGSANADYSSLASADFNGDGNPDLVVMYDGSPAVFLGNGDGTFQSSAIVATGGTYYDSLAIADFNGDGKPDLVCLNTAYNGGVGVLIGNGDGTFQLPVNYTDSSITYADAFVVGDFNGDGKTDVAVIYWTAVTVLLGNGDGTLHGVVKTQLTSTPGYFAISGDFNGDGKLDIAYTGYYGDYISIAFGNGDGTFIYGGYESGTTLPTDGYNGAIAPADFNGDGKLDFAVSNNSSNTVDVFLGGQFSGLALSLSHTGNFTIGQTGTYQAIVGNPAFLATSGTVTFTETLPAGMTATSIAGSGWTCTLSNLTCTRSDALADGTSYAGISIVVDVAAGLQPSTLTNRASVSNGGVVNSATDPTSIVLATATALAVSPNPSTLGQAVTLTATVTAGATGTVEFFDGGAMVGAATLAGAQAGLTTRLLGSGAHSLWATYSGDATHAASSSGVKLQTVNALQASGLAAPVGYATGVGPTAIATGDFNGDGKTDLVTVNSGANTVSVLLGNGDGTYRAKVDYAVGTQPASVVVADFNNDGKPDLAVVNTTSNNLSILLGNGDGTFQAAVNYATGNGPVTLAAADFNGDGKADLVAGNAADDTLSFLFGNGDGTFHAAASTIFANSPAVIAVGDFNKDGKTDIVYGCYAGIYVLLGNGDGTFQQSYYGSSYGVGGLAVGDLNGDGKSDIVGAGSGYGVYVYLGNGDGTFQSYVTYQAGSSPLGVVIADVNGDGKLDVVAANSGSNTIGVLLGNGDGTLQSAASYPVGSQPRAVAAGDFNGDGRTDLASANYGSNNVSVMLGIFTPVLSAASTHAGTFAPGQAGAVYTVVVTNNGPGATSGAVTLTDTLPPALTATAMAGTGWNCVLATVTCTRSDSLAASTNYPVVALTVNVSPNSPFSVTNLVGVTGVNAIGTSSSDVTAIVAVTAASVAPASGSGGSQTFTLQYADTMGVTDLTTAWVWFTANFNPASPANSCLVYYARATNQLFLFNSAGTAWLSPATLGGAGTLSNSQCSIGVAAATVSTSGNNLTLNLPVTFTAAYAGAKSTYMYAAGSIANSGWQAIGSWTIAAVNAVSATPSGGTGFEQTFALQYADSLGATDLTTAWVWITANFNPAAPANSCLAYYNKAANQLFLFNDAGTGSLAPATPGAAGTLSNSQCSINVAAASVGTSGTNLTLSLPVTFTAAYAGAKNTYMYAAGSSAASSGWQTMGSWTVPATVSAVTAVSVTPGSGSGLQQTFALQYADSLGATDLTTVWVWITANFNPASPSNSCLVYYAKATNQLFLFNSAGSAWLSPATPGAAGTLNNSQCSIGVAAATVTTSGTNLTLNLPVTFTAAYAGAKSAYMYAAGSSASSGWQTMGSWTVPSTVAAATAVSAAPNSGSGAQQTFALQYADTLGATDLATAWVWITASFDPAAPSNSCLVYYARATNQLFLFNNAGTAWLAPATLGAAGTLGNSQCSINVATATVTTSGTVLTLNLPVTFTAAYAGAKNTYMYAAGSTANSGWQTMGSWTVPATVTAVTAASVIPSAGSSLQQTFALQYADSLGATEMTTVWVWITASFDPASPSNSCLVYYARAANQLFLFNDAGTAWLAPATLGAAGTLSNSQCSIGVADATVTTSGTGLTLNLPVTFTAAYAGAKSTYMYAAGSSANSGWQTMGSWIVP
jgi:uncharacterized repeat protein (TIGR01451 family)